MYGASVSRWSCVYFIGSVAALQLSRVNALILARSKGNIRNSEKLPTSEEEKEDKISSRNVAVNGLCMQCSRPARPLLVGSRLGYVAL